MRKRGIRCRNLGFLFQLAFLIGLIHCTDTLGQLVVEKIEPPSWWTPSTVNPIRVLLTGKNLHSDGLSIKTSSNELIASNFKSSQNGHYLFFDLKFSKVSEAGQIPK